MIVRPAPVIRDHQVQSGGAEAGAGGRSVDGGRHVVVLAAADRAATGRLHGERRAAEIEPARQPDADVIADPACASPGPGTLARMQPRNPLLDQLDAFVGFVRKRVDDQDLAADIVQEALAKALAHAGDLRDDDRIVAWFYRILRNTIADVQARRSRERQRSVPVDDGDDLSASAEEMRAVCACLGDAIRTLKPEYAEVLHAVDLGGEEPEATAGRLGITPNNLKVRRHRAREALRERLHDTCRMCAAHGCLDCHCGSGGHQH